MPSDDRPITVFYSYAHADEKLRDELAKHLSLLKNQGYIQEWHDRDIEAGQEWEGRIDQHLAAAQFILLLISPDFMASPYCYSIELKRAMERHAAGEARVVPIILKPVDWQSAPFGQLQALPKNAKAVTTWPNRDEAFLDIAQGIRRAVERLRGGSSASPPRPTAPTPTAIPTPTTAGPLRHDQTATVTGGGAYIRGNVNTGGGKFVGRDDHSTVAPPATATPAQLPVLLQELRIALAAVPLDADERAALQDDLAVVEAQWAKPEPKRALLRAKLASLQSLIEAAAGGMEATAEPLRLLHHLARISRQ